MRLVLAFALVAFPANAQTDPAFAARTAAEQLRAAEAMHVVAESARDRVLALSQTISAYETGLESFREGLRRAAQREAEIRHSFEAESARLAAILGTLQSMGGATEAQLLLHPAGALDTVRSGMLLAEVAPALAAEANAMKSALDELYILQALQEGAEETLSVALRGAQTARTELGQAISERRDLPRRFLSDPEELSALLTSAETLDAFATGLTEIGAAPLATSQAILPFDGARGKLPLPVNSIVLRGFKEGDAAGIKRPGLVLATPPNALVTAPWASTIRYRGPLLDYGNVMVLEPQAGYLLIVAGLAEVYGEAGEVVPTGGAVGLMGGTAAETQAFFDRASDQSGAIRRETLYVELRDDGTPVDPATWFALTRE